MYSLTLSMAHKVEISDKTYDLLKEYCALNKLKIGQYADKFIYDGLMIDMYGDVPFTTYKKPPQEMVEIPFPKEIIEKFPPEKFEEEYMQQPGPITEEIKKRYEDMAEVKRMARKHEKEKEEAEQFKRSIDEAIAEGEEKLKQAGVPTKVVNKITKRRLK